MTPDELPIRHIPPSWSVQRLSDLCTLITKGSTPTTFGFDWVTDGIPFLRSECISGGILDLSAAQAISMDAHKFMARSAIVAGDLLVTITGNVGRACLFPVGMPESNINQHIARLRIAELSYADPGYIFYALSSHHYRAYFERIVTGLAYPQLSLKQVRDTLVPLPPLPEQRKIAAILASVDDTIAATQAVINQLQTVKEAMMEELLTRGIPGRHMRFQSCEFGRVPEQWDLVRFDEVCTQVRHTVAVVADQMYQQVGIRSHGKGLFHKEPISGLELGNKQVFWIEPECLVLNIVFAWEGAVASTTVVEKGMIASHRFPMYRPDLRRLVIQYLRLLMQSKTAVHMLGNMSPGGAGRNKTLNQGALKRLRIPIPPVKEQSLIAGTIVSVEERVTAEVEKVRALTVLKSALLSSLLTGEIRVPVEPDPTHPEVNP